MVFVGLISVAKAKMLDITVKMGSQEARPCKVDDSTIVNQILTACDFDKYNHFMGLLDTRRYRWGALPLLSNKSLSFHKIRNGAEIKVSWSPLF